MTIPETLFCLALIAASLCGCGRSTVEKKRANQSTVSPLQTVLVGDSISDAEEKILGSGGERVMVAVGCY